MREVCKRPRVRLRDPPMSLDAPAPASLVSPPASLEAQRPQAGELGDGSDDVRVDTGAAGECEAAQLGEVRQAPCEGPGGQGLAPGQVEVGQRAAGGDGGEGCVGDGRAAVEVQANQGGAQEGAYPGVWGWAGMGRVRGVRG